MKLKVCGMRDASNIESLALEGTDFMGFIFFEKSPRNAFGMPAVSVEVVKNKGIVPVAVFVNESVEKMTEIASFYGINTLQLHGDETADDCRILKKSGLSIIKAISISEAGDFSKCLLYEGNGDEKCCDYFLFDTKTKAYGGSGVGFDWDLLANYKGETPYFLSGGITVSDVEKIKSLGDNRLMAVDINSRFEVKPGMKDVEKVKVFKHLLNNNMSNRIKNLFGKKSSGILSVYFTAGYPQPDDTMAVLRALQSKGIDMVEIGVPFSDPMADGPVIQQSSNVALRNGMTLKKLFGQIASMRDEITIPVILMGYLNVIMQYGLEDFCKDCKAVGVDGVILPDLPMKDYLQEYKPMMDKYGLSMVLLITPETADDRILEIDANTDSFIYMVSSASTTGAQKQFSFSVQDYFRRINAMNLKNPRMIGFGISNKATLQAAFDNASGAIIGSKFIDCLNNNAVVADAVDDLLSALER